MSVNFSGYIIGNTSLTDLCYIFNSHSAPAQLRGNIIGSR